MAHIDGNGSKQVEAVISLFVWDEIMVLDLAVIRIMDHCSLTAVELVFTDFEPRSNIIGLYDLLLRIDRRANPQNYL